MSLGFPEMEMFHPSENLFQTAREQFCQVVL